MERQPKKSNTLSRLGLGALATVVLALVAACGPVQPQTVTVVETVVVETEKEVTVVETVEVIQTVEVEKIVEVAPEPGERTLTIGMNELVSSLDPPTDWAIAATWIHMNIFDCLEFFFSAI